MKAWKLFLLTKLFQFFPETRLFSLKAAMLRWAGADVGENVRICSSVRILGKGPLVLGNDVWIGPETLIVASASIRIGNFVDIAPRVFIGTGTHEVDTLGEHSAGKGISKDIVIEDGVWIGVSSVILAGVVIGRKSVIAAGAVVVGSIKEKLLVGGVPAKIIRSI